MNKVILFANINETAIITAVTLLLVVIAIGILVKKLNIINFHIKFKWSGFEFSANRITEREKNLTEKEKY